MPAVRKTMEEKIGNMYRGLDLTLECFPDDHVQDDPQAFLKAISTMQPGDVAIIFTPDDTHFDITSACIRHGLHVLVAKPIVKTLKEHLQLLELAAEYNVMLGVEYHKRFDPIYSDARDRIRQLGPFSYYYSYMAQQKQQLDTFRSWAGKSSDINYYLNSHHIDIHNWCVSHMAYPVRVTATACTGEAIARLGRPCEDTITLTVQWVNKEDGSKGTAVYTASWIAPKGECHTRQHFHYMGRAGEIHADQAHRGYNTATDAGGYAALNPLYMKYTPDANGFFAGRSGYGYISIARFISTATALQAKEVTLEQVQKEGVLALVDNTVVVTAILEAGRMSLDNDGASVSIQHDDNGRPLSLKVLH